MTRCDIVHEPLEWLKIYAPDVLERVLKEYDRVNGFIPYDQGYIYAIQAVGTDFIKIGKTTNPDRRILQIAPQMPFPTRYIRVWRSNFMSLSEKRLHQEFGERRAHGEWFELTASDLHALFYQESYYYTESILNSYADYFLEVVTEGIPRIKSRILASVEVGLDQSCFPPARMLLVSALFKDIQESRMVLPSDFSEEDLIREFSE